MKQQWHKLGMIFCPSDEKKWMYSHASVPIAEHIYDDFFKVYFSSRDRLNRSFTGYVVIDINRPNEILELSDQPVLTPGKLGEFDDNGAMATWLVEYHGRKYLYYIGWNLGVSVPFRNSIGLATSSNGKGFARSFSGPIIDRSMNEPHFSASCCVIPEGVGGDAWKMWYLSCTDWCINNGKPRHNYHIKYAQSEDGINWDRNGDIAIDYLDENEYAISRPSVIYDNNIWKMWFSSKGETYRIRYAESLDGVIWERLDCDVGIDVSTSGWDSEMIEYPCVFDHKGQRYMLYNGNGYGISGFGLAVLA